jgi:hypothetical protein
MEGERRCGRKRSFLVHFSGSRAPADVGKPSQPAIFVACGGRAGARGPLSIIRTERSPMARHRPDARRQRIAHRGVAVRRQCRDAGGEARGQPPRHDALVSSQIRKRRRTDRLPRRPPRPCTAGRKDIAPLRTAADPPPQRGNSVIWDNRSGAQPSSVLFLAFCFLAVGRGLCSTSDPLPVSDLCRRALTAEKKPLVSRLRHVAHVAAINIATAIIVGRPLERFSPA